MNSTLTMRQAIDLGAQSDDPKLRQYSRALERMLAVAGITGPDLNDFQANMTDYLTLAPKYAKRSIGIAEIIVAQGWKEGTYKQYQSDGRRMIEHAIGTLAARQQRRALQDDWAMLKTRVQSLVDAGLEAEARLRSLAKITDLSRAANWPPQDLTHERVMALRVETASHKEWEIARRGTTFLDDLRTYPTLRNLLPAAPIGEITTLWREANQVPEALLTSIGDWLRTATVILPQHVETPEAHALLQEELSDGAQGVYAAALRGYIDTLHRLDLLPTGSRLPDLFSRSCIERVLVDWSQAHLTKQPGALAPRSQFRYAAALRLTLLRNGLSEAAGVIHELCTIMPVLKEGYHANKIMAEETVAWCSALLAEGDKTRIFEMQHVLYRQRAEEALRAAEVAGFDLVTLAHPEKMKELSEKKRSLASKLLREARMFGSCAAFAAVELEGAPFRKANTLGLMMSGGGRRTFFDHAKGAQPHFRIVIPNELLKNGKSLTKRGQTMPPVIIAPPGPGSYATDILRFFLRRIRPLFPGAPHSHALFAPLDPKHSHLQDGTFDDWLLQCSKAIGLPLTPHNFRHGICSIQINDDPNCVEDLAILLADKPETIRRYYAFILREERLRQMQADRAARRAAYGVPRNAVGVA